MMIVFYIIVDGKIKYLSDVIPTVYTLNKGIFGSILPG